MAGWLEPDRVLVDRLVDLGPALADAAGAEVFGPPGITPEELISDALRRTQGAENGRATTMTSEPEGDLVRRDFDRVLEEMNQFAKQPYRSPRTGIPPRHVAP
jgi:hypothetical protein